MLCVSPSSRPSARLSPCSAAAPPVLALLHHHKPRLPPAEGRAALSPSSRQRATASSCSAAPPVLACSYATTPRLLSILALPRLSPSSRRSARLPATGLWPAVVPLARPPGPRPPAAPRRARSRGPLRARQRPLQPCPPLVEVAPHQPEAARAPRQPQPHLRRSHLPRPAQRGAQVVRAPPPAVRSRAAGPAPLSAQAPPLAERQRSGQGAGRAPAPARPEVASRWLPVLPDRFQQPYRSSRPSPRLGLHQRLLHQPTQQSSISGASTPSPEQTAVAAARVQPPANTDKSGLDASVRSGFASSRLRSSSRQCLRAQGGAARGQVSPSRWSAAGNGRGDERRSSATLMAATRRRASSIASGQAVQSGADLGHRTGIGGGQGKGVAPLLGASTNRRTAS